MDTHTSSPPRTTRTDDFDGTVGRLAGPVMARMNRDMERAAIEELAPGPKDSVLAVGFGPGVGIAELTHRLPHGVVGGVDPSGTMVDQARRRNAAAIAAGQVQLERATAAAMPWPDETFSGVTAVNSLQLWEPLDASIREVARVLASGGLLVTLTHVWAIEKRSSLDMFVATTSALLGHAGLDNVTHRTGRFRSGAGLLLRARKPHPCNQIAPGSPPAGR